MYALQRNWLEIMGTPKHSTMFVRSLWRKQRTIGLPREDSELRILMSEVPTFERISRTLVSAIRTVVSINPPEKTKRNHHHDHQRTNLVVRADIFFSLLDFLLGTSRSRVSNCQSCYVHSSSRTILNYKLCHSIC